jgi:hypothetical protein
MAPRRSAKDLQSELDNTKTENGTLRIALHDLVKDPKSVIWLSEGTGESKVAWGIIRPASATGGYVIRRVGIDCMNTDYLDHVILAARGMGQRASDYGEVTRQQIENENLLIPRALGVRARALADADSRRTF